METSSGADLTYGHGHYVRRGVWCYALTGAPVPGAVDLQIRGRIVISAPELHPDELLDTADAAKYWGCALGSWRQYVGRGSVPRPVLYLAGSPFWTRGVIDEWCVVHPAKRGRPRRIQRT